MYLHSLKPATGSVKSGKRIGRGQGSGKGGTSTKGHKGAKSRSGYSAKSGFEGGQMPLQRRLPKFGFNNPNKVYFKAVNLEVIQKLAQESSVTEFNLQFFLDNGLSSKNDKVKILGRGELTAKINVQAHAISASAKEAIEKAGGKFELI